MTTEITKTESANTPVMLANFSLEALEGKKRLYNALNSPQSLDESGVTTLNLVGLCVTPTEEVDPATGEIKNGFQTVFMTTDGNNYFSKSFGLGRSALALINACGGALPEDCQVEVFEVKLDAKRTMKQLRWV